jgi:hypothetical protein
MLMLTGCASRGTTSPTSVTVQVLDSNGKTAVADAEVSAVHPTSRDLAVARTDVHGQAVLHFRFIAYPFVIGIKQDGTTKARLLIQVGRSSTNIFGEAWLGYETEIDTGCGTVKRKPLVP